MRKLFTIILFSINMLTLSGQIQVITNFEGGNGVLLESGDYNYVRVGAELKLGDTRNINFYCQIVELDATIPLQFELDAEFVGNHIFYSFDNLSWIQSDVISNGQFLIPLEGTEVYLAHFQPYLYSHLETYLSNLQNQYLDYVDVSILTESPLGSPVEIVTFTDPCTDNTEKKVIWILGRQHAGEVPVSYVIEGMMDAFSMDNYQMQRLRKEAIIKVVPMMDVDMCILGGTGKDQDPVDFNRDWISPDHNSHWDAVETVKQLMDDMPNEISLFLDMHTFAPGEPANVQIALQLGSQVLFTQNFIERTAVNGGLDYSILPWTEINLAVSQDYVYEFHYNPNLLSLTPETAFEMAPDGTFWTTEKLIAQGIAFGKTCSDYINGLNQPLEVVIDNTSSDVVLDGSWTTSSNFPGYFGNDYLYAEPNTMSTCTFVLTPDMDGLYEISSHYSSDPNRADNANYQIAYNGEIRDYVVDQTILGSRWRHIDTMTLIAGEPVSLTIDASNSNGFVIADAFRIYPVNHCINTDVNISVTLKPTKINCYPNPSSGEFDVELFDQEIGSSYFLRLYNSMGQLMEQRNITATKATFSIKNKGIYFLELINEKKEIIGLEKVLLY